MKKTGIYIHIPFCRSKCLYCDFCSHRPANDEKAVYISALCGQIRSYKARFEGYSADTVYLGGGTPTLLNPHETDEILGTLSQCITIDKDAEITSECNPATVNYAQLCQLRALGINRLSIGAQSFDDNELKKLGRIHSAREIAATYSDARKAKFDNISLDLMYGIPAQTYASWGKTLDAALSLDPEHISAYGLRVEKSTPFGRMGSRLVLPDDDTVADMYLLCVSKLEQKGICQYEISNFAKHGYESRHNLKYWKCEEYVGFGVAAHSCFGGFRYAAPADFAKYCGGVWVDEQSKVEMNAKNTETDYVMLSMRLSEGLQIKEYEKRFGVSLQEKYAKRFFPYLDGGFVTSDDRGWRFTPKGMLVSNTILSDILYF